MRWIDMIDLDEWIAAHFLPGEYKEGCPWRCNRGCKYWKGECGIKTDAGYQAAQWTISIRER